MLLKIGSSVELGTEGELALTLCNLVRFVHLYSGSHFGSLMFSRAFSCWDVKCGTVSPANAIGSVQTTEMLALSFFFFTTKLNLGKLV